MAVNETVYSATKVFDSITGERVISVDANGGSVVIQVQHGTDNWITVETIATDSAKVLNFGTNRIYKFVVNGSATYAI